jgi:hypothetical protein
MATRAYVQIRNNGNAGGAIFAAIGIISWNDINDLLFSDPPGPITNCNADWINRWVALIAAGSPAGL